MDEAHRGGRQDGVAQFAAEGRVLPGGELGPEPQPVAHPDRGPGNGHRGRRDPTPAPVPVGAAGSGSPGTGRPRTDGLAPGISRSDSPDTRPGTSPGISPGTIRSASPGTGNRIRNTGPLPVRPAAQPVPEPHTITRLR